MPSTHPPYAPEYRRRIIELARAGRSIKELAREFEPSANAIRKWVKQAALDERLRSDGQEAHGEFESECPGYCGAQDTFYVGTLKGVGRVYQQTFVDTYTKLAFAKLYDRKTPLVAADLLNDRVIP